MRTRNGYRTQADPTIFVAPAKAGVSGRIELTPEMPAFAGMTNRFGDGLLKAKLARPEARTKSLTA